MSNPTELLDLDPLEALARAATPGRWMRFWDERTVYDRLEDGCRGNAIVRADLGYSVQDTKNLDFIAAANPAAVLALIALARRAQPEGEAPQAEARIVTYVPSRAKKGVFKITAYGPPDMVLPAHREIISDRLMYPAAQHAESGAPADTRAYDALRSIRDLAYFDSTPSGRTYYEKAENALAAIAGRDVKAAAQQAAAPGAEPVMWFEAEPSARGRDAKEVIGSMLYSTRIHTLKAPVTSNPVWPLYAAPVVAPSAPGTPEAPQTAAARDVLAERKRQMEVEGWTPAHDNEHADGQMAGAAACYAVHDITHWARAEITKTLWPWASEWWKPRTKRENLIRAGALVLAEIERLDRAAQLDGGPEAPAELPRLYRFDCYIGKTKMAAGVGVHATSMAEAEEKAKKLADKEETVKFDSNQPCHPSRKCSICAEYERAAQLYGGQEGSDHA